MFYKGAEISFRLIFHGGATHKYEASLLAGTWPSDRELISLADGNDGTHEPYFGGYVENNGFDKKFVSVYVD